MRHLAQRQEHRITATGHQIQNTAGNDIRIHCGTQIEKRPVEWEIKERHVTPGGPAVQAAGAQTPPEACESRHWNLQSPGLPGQLSPYLQE